MHVLDPPQTPRRPGSGRLEAPGPPNAAAFSMGRAHSANTELAEISCCEDLGSSQHSIRGRRVVLLSSAAVLYHLACPSAVSASLWQVTDLPSHLRLARTSLCQEAWDLRALDELLVSITCAIMHLCHVPGMRHVSSSINTAWQENP